MSGARTAAADPVIRVDGLKKSYGATRAVDGVSFEVRAGTVFGLLGPNGAGKTTTVECLIGLRDPDAGTIEVCGIDARRRPQAVKQKIGAALQSTALQDKITAREALTLYGSFYARQAAPQALLERFALLDKADAPFDTLSGGQRQRLAIALAFVSNPEVVFLDEPTTGLDPQARANLWTHIRGLREERGTTVFLTTHYLDEADALCDRILVIDHGAIVASGTPDELKSQVGGDVVTVTVGSGDDTGEVARLVGALSGAEQPQVVDDRIIGRVPHGGAALVDLVRGLDGAGITVSGIESRRPSLDDVFLGLTGRSLRDSDAPAPAAEEVAV